MYLNQEEITVPSLANFTGPEDFDLLVPSLNSLFGEELIHAFQPLDLLNAENSTFVMSGATSAVGFASGENVTAYTEGLAKTLITNSENLELFAADGNTSVILDAELTERAQFLVASSELKIFDLSSNDYQLDAFELTQNTIFYSNPNINFEIQIEGNFDLTIYSLGANSPIHINNSELGITIAQADELIHLGQLSEVKQDLKKETSLLEKPISRIDEGPIEVLSEPDFDISELLEIYYENLNLSQKITGVEELELSTQLKNLDALSDMLAELDFSSLIQTSENEEIEIVTELETMTAANDVQLEQALTLNDVTDFLFEDPLEFYHEI